MKLFVKLSIGLCLFSNAFNIFSEQDQNYTSSTELISTENLSQNLDQDLNHEKIDLNLSNIKEQAISTNNSPENNQENNSENNPNYSEITEPNIINNQATKNNPEKDGYVLSSPILKFIDGIPGVMDAKVMHKTIYIGQELTKFMYGEIDKKTKERVPQHSFNNRLYTLKQLVKIEKELTDKKQNQNLSLLKTSLEKVKSDFQKVTSPFIKEARGTRQQMVELIKESCKLRHRTDSALLAWSETNELDGFNKSIVSFKQLDTFCVDLINFLKDLKASCPKAYKQFLAWKQKQQAKN